jgi:hypothetical protein
VEGNPLHPNNQGSTSAFAQASVLDLYDPDRLKYPVYENPNRGQLAATWDDFKFWAGTHFAKFDATGGAGLAFIADKQSSPTRERMRQAVLDRWPQAQWVSWSPAEGRGARSTAPAWRSVRRTGCGTSSPRRTGCLPWVRTSWIPGPTRCSTAAGWRASGRFSTRTNR